MIFSLLGLLLIPLSLVTAIVVLGRWFFRAWRSNQPWRVVLSLLALTGQGFLLAETAFFFAL